MALSGKLLRIVLAEPSATNDHPLFIRIAAHRFSFALLHIVRHGYLFPCRSGEGFFIA